MPGAFSIAVVGDFNAHSENHRATNDALRHAAHQLGIEAEARWVPTSTLEGDPRRQLEADSGCWIAPGSPYKSMDGALQAIRWAREEGVPLLGTCGGFQHIVIEYARNVLGFVDAQHAEYDPCATNLFITPLSCSLAGQTMPIAITAGSRAAEFYGATSAEERYYCNFGLNPVHQQLLHDNGLKVVGIDKENEARILEIPDHPFFMATLFLPQARSRSGNPHPLICAYLQAARAYRDSRASAAVG